MEFFKMLMNLKLALLYRGMIIIAIVRTTAIS